MRKSAASVPSTRSSASASTCPARPWPSSASRLKWASSMPTRASRPTRRPCTARRRIPPSQNSAPARVEAACDLVSELYRLAGQLREEGDPSGRFDPAYSTIHVGKIQGGTARNILARRCTLQLGDPRPARRRAQPRAEAYGGLCRARRAAEAGSPRHRRADRDAFVHARFPASRRGCGIGGGDASQEAYALERGRHRGLWDGRRTVSRPSAFPP